MTDLSEEEITKNFREGKINLEIYHNLLHKLASNRWKNQVSSKKNKMSMSSSKWS